MKTLLILLLLTACAQPKPAKKVEGGFLAWENAPPIKETIAGSVQEIDIQRLMEEIEKGNFSVLEPFLETNELFPASFVRDGYVIDFAATDTLDYTESIPNIDFTNPLTNMITFTNAGEPVTYTNKYGIPFVESRKLVIPLDILTNMRQYKCDAFEWALRLIAESTNLEQVFDSDMEFGDSSYLVYLSIEGDIGRYLEQQQEGIRTKWERLVNDKVQHYIRNYMTPSSLDETKNAMINYQVHLLTQDYRGTKELYPTPVAENQSCYP